MKYIAGAIGAINVLVGGVSIDNVTSVTLPDVGMTMTDVKGAGILGTVQMPVTGQLESMTATIETRRAGKQRAGLMAAGEQSIEVRIGENVRTSGGELAAEGTKVFLAGYFTKASGGKAEPGSPRGESYEYAVYRYREIVDGEEVALIDQLNQIFKVDGVDQMRALRALL